MPIRPIARTDKPSMPPRAIIPPKYGSVSRASSEIDTIVAIARHGPHKPDSR